jgi:hypothetical protein
MAYKIYLTGNMLTIEDTVSTHIEKLNASSIDYNIDDSGVFSIFDGIRKHNFRLGTFDEIIDATDTPFSSKDALTTFFDDNLNISGVGTGGGGGGGESNVSIIDETTEISARVNNDGQLHIVGEGHLCTNNSTETPLGAGGVYTGTAENILPYNGIALFVKSDADSALVGLEIQFSKDGVNNWQTSEAYTVLANAAKWFTPPSFGVYFRVKYTNGSSPQTNFELTTKLSKFPFKWSSHNIEEPITDQDDAELTKSVITGKKSNGDYDNVSLTNGGNMKISLEEFESGISENSNSQLKTSPYIIDEYGIFAHILGDNIFRGAIITIPTEHHEIHCGDSYECGDTDELGNGASEFYAIIVPDEGTIDGTNTGANQGVKQYHSKAIIETQSEALVNFYEGATLSANGTQLTVINRNRNSTLTDFLAVYKAPTITNSGTLLPMSKRLGSDRRVGGRAGRENEIIMKNNTIYLVEIINEVTTANNYNFEIDYYVHPGI